MFMLDATKQKIELVPLETSVDRDRATRTLMVRVRGGSEHDPANAASLVTCASRAFFEIGQPGKRASVAAEQPPKGPPPVAFRETKTGLLHLVYREVVIRFRPGTAQKKRQQILKKSGLKVRRTNPFVSDQVIVYHPNRRYSGDKLLEIANQCAQMEEVVFSTPNFVSQFVRQAAPPIRVEEWHLRNTGVNGAKKGEDVNILEAWKTTTGKRSIVVAVLDDGVDVGHPNLKTRIWKNPNRRAADQIGRDFFLPDNHSDHFNPRPKRFQFPFDQMRGNDLNVTCHPG